MAVSTEWPLELADSSRLERGFAYHHHYELSNRLGSWNRLRNSMSIKGKRSSYSYSDDIVTRQCNIVLVWGGAVAVVVVGEGERNVNS